MREQLGILLSKQVLHYCREYRDADETARRLEQSINHLLAEIDAGFDFLQQNADSLTPEIRVRLEDALRELVRGFQIVCETFSLAKGSDLRVRRGRWAFRVNEALEALVADMEIWQNRFVRYVQMLRYLGYRFQEIQPRPRTASFGPPTATKVSINSRITSPAGAGANDELALSMLPVSDNELQSMAVSLLQRPRQAASRADFLVEHRTIGRDEDPSHVLSVIKNTVRILSTVDPQLMHVLRCEGYTTEPLHRRHRLVLSFPNRMNNPRGLRDVLIDEGLLRPSINARIQLSIQIATAVLYTHTSGLVHKSIRPEDIVLFQYDESITAGGLNSPSGYQNVTIGVPYLTGFSSARTEAPNIDSSLRHSDDWKRDLYNHPSRQCQPTLKYTMAHDIFSVGVILLEIGLWESLITFDHSKKDDRINERVIPNGNEMYENLKHMRPDSADGMLATFKQVAESELPSEMGCRFSQIVGRCLRCVDDGFDQPTSVLGQDKERMGLGYIELVLEELENIRV